MRSLTGGMRCAQGACALEGDNLIPLFYLSDVKPNEVHEYKSSLNEIVQNYEGGEFSLFFANCEPLSAVSFDLQVGPLLSTHVALQITAAAAAGRTPDQCQPKMHEQAASCTLDRSAHP